jgi:O-antigen ligase
LLAALLGSALFQVIFGAQRWVVQAREIWGVPVPSDPTRLRGTFVNPNHLAAFVGIALPVAFAWAWWGLRRARHEPRSERRLLLVGVPVLVWLTLFAGLAFSRSRAGMLAAVAAAAAQGVLLAWSQRRWRWLAAGALALAAGAVAVAATGFAEGFGRFAGEGLRSGVRGEVYVASLALWRRFPWLGTGLGTFRDAFPLVQPPGLGDLAFWHAHGDPLELLVTTGLVGMALAAAGLVSLLRRLGRVLRFGMRSEDSAAGLAALGAVVALGVHEAFDFGLTMPANALAAAIVCGAALTAERRAPLAAGPPAAPPAGDRRRRG